ncbi:MAG TPA: carboxypeptidase-like regulatory domain-containing protein, partial [Candidatus Baltobacteraceae bacterium]|nr:carboxypeptidase-like regulatory domain-containing protein [Candidatus Baltobacteraceae bacterium]
MGLRKRHAALLRAALCVLLLVAFGVTGSGLAIASTTGVLSGTVTDASTHQPLANVRVTAASPSGSYSGTTNARGFYSIAGVYADTYTVSFQLTGYQASSIPGVSVFADQVETQNVALNKALRTIATVVSRGGSAFQPNQTTDTVTVTQQQIQNFQGSTFNSSETNLLISLPGATADSSGYPVIHGGREYEEGFEFEGIPYTDAYSNQFNNSLAIPTAGVSLVQLTPGGGDVASGTGGGFGSFNVVAKRGTYPAYANIGGAVGSPGFDHRLNFDYSWATPDGRWSNYMSFANADNADMPGRNQYPLAHIGEFYSTKYESDREWLDNLYYRFGRNNSQSLQLFVDLADHHFYQGAGGFGNPNGVCGAPGASGYQQLCFPSGDPTYRNTWAFYLSPGTYGFCNCFWSPDQVSAVSPLYPGQSSEFESLQQASNRAPFTYFQPNQAYKIGYTNNLNSSTYLNITAYRTNSVVTFDGPSTEGSFAGDVYILQGGMTNGVTLSLQKQLSDKHLFEFGADVSHLHPIDSYLSDSFSFLGDVFTGTLDQLLLPNAFLPNDDTTCPLAAAGPNLCGYAFQAGGNNAKYPVWSQVSTVQRQDYSLFVSDKWQPNTRLNIQLGLRMDAATYRMPTPGIDPSTCTSLYLPVTYTAPTLWDPEGINGPPSFTCDAKATFSFPNDAVRPKVFQPRTGISYKLGQDTAIRFTYNRAVQFVPISSVDFGEIDPNAYLKTYGKLPPYNVSGQVLAPAFGLPAGTKLPTACGYPGVQVECTSFGEQLYWAAQNWDGIAYQPARPTTSNNYQLTIEHQFT